MQITTMALTWVFLLFCAYYHKPSNVFLAFWIPRCWPRAACLSVCPRNILIIKCSPVCLFNRNFNFQLCHNGHCQLPEVASTFFFSPLSCSNHFEFFHVERLGTMEWVVVVYERVITFVGYLHHLHPILSSQNDRSYQICFRFFIYNNFCFKD